MSSFKGEEIYYEFKKEAFKAYQGYLVENSLIHSEALEHAYLDAFFLGYCTYDNLHMKE